MQIPTAGYRVYPWDLLRLVFFSLSDTVFTTTVIRLVGPDEESMPQRTLWLRSAPPCGPTCDPPYGPL